MDDEYLLYSGMRGIGRLLDLFLQTTAPSHSVPFALSLSFNLKC
uniref:Uncharacterized protein n=1 Tax=Anguilla anguilla TaxID=7936 RepID=A0A0E9P6L0_ANGAN